MQLLLTGYRSVFNRLPRPARIGVNLCLFPVVIALTIGRILRDHFKYPEPMLPFGQKELDDVLYVDATEDALQPLHDLQNLALNLSQDGRWAELHRLMASFDTRRATFGTTRLVGLAGAGARGMHLQEMQDFADCSAMDIGDIDTSELMRLDLAHAARPDDPYLAGITARAHLDMAWALRGGGYADEVSTIGWEGYTKHVNRAQAIMAPFDAIALDSAFVAATNHLIAPNTEDANRALHETYAIYAQIDPLNWSIMGDYAFHLLPRWYGDYNQIEVAARNAIAASEDVAGTAAYAAFYMGILHRDDGAIDMVEPALLEQSLRDMIEYGGRDPVEINAIVSYCTDTFAHQFGLFHTPGEDHIHEKRAALRAIPKALIRDYLTQIVPEVWTIAPPMIRQVIGLAFVEELSQGATIELTDAGPKITLPQQDAARPEG